MPQKIITETTLRRVLDELKTSNILMNDLATGYTIDSWQTVAEIVQKGLAPVRFSVGDQFFIDWTRSDVETSKPFDYTYKLPFDVRHFCDVLDENGDKHPGMVLQSHYCMPFNVQFDASENQQTTDETFQEGYYYYLKQDNGKYIKFDATPGEPIPKEGIFVRNELNNAQEVITDGYNRWSHSGIRQWLNSDKPRNEWWKAQHDGDTPPNALSTKDGFMKGLAPDFLDVVKPVQIRTAKNTVTDDGGIETTVDRFFLPATEEVYGWSGYALNEGEVWKYFKEGTGFEEASNLASPCRIFYKFNNETSKEYTWLRTANRNGPWGIYGCTTEGRIGHSDVSYAWGHAFGGSSRVAPACVIW